MAHAEERRTSVPSHKQSQANKRVKTQACPSRTPNPPLPFPHRSRKPYTHTVISAYFHHPETPPVFHIHGNDTFSQTNVRFLLARPYEAVIPGVPTSRRLRAPQHNLQRLRSKMDHRLHRHSIPASNPVSACGLQCEARRQTRLDASREASRLETCWSNRDHDQEWQVGCARGGRRERADE